jgi:hypothetical protein
MKPISSDSLKKYGPIAAGLMGALVAGCSADTTGSQASSAAASSAMPPEPMSSSASSLISDMGAYADGTYSADGNYVSPAGAEEVGVTVVLDDGVITDATVESKATHPTSKKLQGMFIEGFKDLVVGKSIDEVSLSVVNGSSLAPKGFMDALAKIKAEASV